LFVLCWKKRKETFSKGEKKFFLYAVPCVNDTTRQTQTRRKISAQQFFSWHEGSQPSVYNEKRVSK